MEQEDLGWHCDRTSWSLCLICGESPSQGIEDDDDIGAGRGCKDVEDLSYVSGRPIRETISNVFPSDAEIQDVLHGGIPAGPYENDEGNPFGGSAAAVGASVCLVCFGLLEQAEAFRTNLERTEWDLTRRRRGVREEVPAPDSKAATAKKTAAKRPSKAVKLLPQPAAGPLLPFPVSDRLTADVAALGFHQDDDSEAAVGSKAIPATTSPEVKTEASRDPMLVLDHHDDNCLLPCGAAEDEDGSGAAAAAADELPIREFSPVAVNRVDFESNGGASRKKSGKCSSATNVRRRDWRRRGCRRRRRSRPALVDVDVLLKPGSDRDVDALMLEVSGFKDEWVRSLAKDFLDDLDYLRRLHAGCHDLRGSGSAAAGRDVYWLRSGADQALLVGDGLLQEGSATCPDCRRSFENPLSKILHVVSEHPERPGKPFYCTVCSGIPAEIPAAGNLFDSEESAWTHGVAAGHHLDLDRRQLLLPDDGPSSQSLSRHPNVKDGGEGAFECRQCSVGSWSELGYWLHWWTRHKVRRAATLCPVCQGSLLPDGRLFSSGPELGRHLLVAHLGYRFHCDEPGCRFSTCSADQMLTHISQPSQEKPRKSDSSRKSSPAGRTLPPPGRRPPLDVYEMAVAIADRHLEPTAKTEHSALSRILPGLRSEMEGFLAMLAKMPPIIEDARTASDWDLSLLKMEMTKFSFGIPGERKCFVCDLEFKSVPDKHLHVVSSHGGSCCDLDIEAYLCPICSRSWSAEETAFNHFRSQHPDLGIREGDPAGAARSVQQPAVEEEEDGSWRCRDCGLVSATEMAFRYHRFLRHKRYRGAACQLCGQELVNSSQHRRHVLVVHGEFRYRCFDCKKVFRPLESFRNHLREHILLLHQGPVLPAALDNGGLQPALASTTTTIARSTRIKDRRQQKSNSKKSPAASLKCGLCGKESRGEKFHAKHMFTQHGQETSIACSECGAECRSIRDLEAHRRAEHCVASCHLCGRPFFSHNHLQSHLKQVHEVGQAEDEFICEMCARSFPTKGYLKVHMRTHNEKHIRCTLCPKMFRWESALRSHLSAAHSQTAQLYNCEFCGKQFKDKSNLRSHRYTHLDVKPHSCSKCGRGFIRRDMMLTHERNCGKVH